MYPRLQTLPHRGRESCFLWGPRQTGKSTLLKSLFPGAPYYDLLLSEEFERFSRKPSLLREETLSSRQQGPIIIDEVQKVPALLDEVHWLMANKKVSFILCGSSTRKLKRGGGNLLGGRALRYELFPLVSREIPNFDLLRALNHGLLPRHYMAKNFHLMGRAYIGDYLKEEIAAEALVRNIPAFARFLEIAAFSNGETVNHQNIAAETGISSPTAKEYFQILVDTLIGYYVPAFRKRPKRRIIQAPKFYFFDVGIANALLKRGTVMPGNEVFGRAFEHFFFQELMAHRHYSGIEYPLAYWRTTSGFEVDFVLGNREVALEIKGVPEVQSRHLRGISAFYEEYKPKKSIVVSLDRRPRRIGPIDILPWKNFLNLLWAGKIIR